MALSPKSKKALAFIPAYLFTMLFFFVAGELAYLVYFNTTELVAGRPPSLIVLPALAQGFFVIAPALLFLSPLVLTLYRVRHSGGGFLPVLSYIALCALTWGVVYPLFINFKVRHGSVVQTEERPLSADYFRRLNDSGLFYLPHDFTSQQMYAVVLNEADDGEAVSFDVVRQNDVAQAAAPFRDILIKETVPSVPMWISDGFMILELRAEYAWRGGFVKWLCFLSLAFALCSAYALTFCSDWRLVNVMYFLVAATGIFALSIVYYSNYFAVVRNLDSAISERISFLDSSDTPLLCALNVLIGVACIATGLIAEAARARRQRRMR